jgi:rhodanese-related sulfurtransferase
MEKGYTKVAAIKGGLAGWKDAGGKTVSSSK